MKKIGNLVILGAWADQLSMPSIQLAYAVLQFPNRMIKTVNFAIVCDLHFGSSMTNCVVFFCSRYHSQDDQLGFAVFCHLDS